MDLVEWPAGVRVEEACQGKNDAEFEAGEQSGVWHTDPLGVTFYLIPSNHVSFAKGHGTGYPLYSLTTLASVLCMKPLDERPVSWLFISVS